MFHELAEKKIKGLQKEFLVNIEHHPVFQSMEPAAFNDLRKRVFRGTFEAYRLGVVGIESVPDVNNLYDYFFHWLNDSTETMERHLQIEVTAMCFRTALLAYRIGCMVSEERNAP